jgi:DNA-binding response OmpR family regulator
MPHVAKMNFRDGELVIDFEKKLIKKSGQEVSLTPSEFNILVALMKYPQKVFTRAELIDIAMDGAFEGYDRVIDNHIKNVRQKIEDDSKNPNYILTIHGIGYKFGGE